MSDRTTAGGFEIDLAGVLQFSTKLRTEVDQHLAPENETIAQAFIAVPSFGARTASTDVQAAANAYHQQLIKLLDLADAFVHNASVLAQAAAEVVAAYENADSLTADDLNAVLKTAALRAAEGTEGARRAVVDPATGVPL